MIADCRRCKWFRRPEECPPVVREVIEYLNEQGLETLGWCMRGNHEVTYYEGRCRYFEPLPEGQRRLDAWLGGE